MLAKHQATIQAVQELLAKSSTLLQNAEAGPQGLPSDAGTLLKFYQKI